MPASLGAGDKKVLIVAGALLAALTVVSLLVAPPPADPSLGYPSSYSAAPDGAKGAYLLLKDLGYRIERWERPPTDLPEDAGGVVLVMAEPHERVSAGERAAIGEFLERGGRLVATGHHGAELIETWRSETSPVFDARPTSYAARSPSPITMNAEEIVLEPRASWIEPAGAPVALFADAAGPGVVVEAFGEGRIIWWAGEGPLTNAGLPEKGNLELFLGSIGPPEDLLVLWDEYYHGQRGSLWGYLAATPVPWGFVQAGALMLAAVLTWGRRTGPIRPALDESRRSPLEFVETIGDLYERAHAASGAVEISYQRVRSALARRLGMPSTAGGEALRARALQCLSWANTGLAETLLESQRALSETTINEWQALQLVQALHAHGRRLAGATPTTRQEAR